MACKSYGNVCCRDDTYDIMMWQLSAGCRDATYSKEVNTILPESVGQVASRPVVSEAARAKLYDSLSLGSYSLIFNNTSQETKTEIKPFKVTEIQRPVLE